MLLLIIYLAFQTSAVQTFVVRQITNQLSKKFNTTISIKSVDISFFNKLILKEVYIEDQKQDTLLYIDNLIATIDHLNLKKHNINLSSVNLLRTKVFLSLNEQHFPNYGFLLDSLRSSKADRDTLGWNITCETFLFDQAKVGYSYFNQQDYHLIDLQNIHLEVSDLNLEKDSIYFRINEMQFNDPKSFSLSNLSAEFVSYRKMIKLRNLKVLTPNSVITQADVVFDQSKMKDGSKFTESYIDVDLKQSQIDLQDVATVVPEIRGMDQKIDISGHVFGKISELKARDLQIKTGNSTAINCDFYVNGLPDFEKTFIQLDLKNSTLDFKDIAAIRLPNSSESPYPKISSTLNEAGVIQYNGNFTGFLSDFVAYGTINSNFGRIRTDLSFRPASNGLLDVNGHIKTINFRLGRFVQNSKLGRVTFGGQIDGQFNQNKNTMNATVVGAIDSIQFNNYKYKNIVLDGLIQEHRFEGDLNIHDKNLECAFNGKLNLDPDSSLFDFELKLDKADLVALQLDKYFKRSELSMHVNANFTGSKIDDIKGAIKFDDGKYVNENDTILLNSLIINTTAAETNRLEIKSDFIDADIEGSYLFASLGKSIENLVKYYLPSSAAEIQETPGLNKFSFDVEMKNLEPVLQTFYPKLRISPGYITGKFDEINHRIDLYSEIENVQLNNMVVKGYSLSIHSNDKLELKTRMEEFQIGDSQRLYNLALLASAADDEMDTKLLWNNYDILTYSGELEGKVAFTKRKDQTNHVDIKIAPSKIYIADTLWQVHPSAMAIDSSRVEFDNVMISNGQQFIAINGIASKNHDDQLELRVKNIDLKNLNLLLGDRNKLNGTMDGSISLIDMYERPLFLSDIKLNDFTYNDTKVGNISALSKWDRASNAVQTELIVSNDSRQTLYGYGSYFPEQDSLDLTLDAEGLSLSLLGPILAGSFQNIHGDATGEVKITGGLDKIEMNGDVLATNAGLALTYLQVGYYFTDTVKFRNDSIIFPNITINDFEGNTGVFNGSIRHDNFSNMDYNLSVNSRNLQIINTTPALNAQFYGKAYANGIVRITGHGQRVNIDGSATTLGHTALNISLDYQQEAEVYDFIRFVDHKSTTEKPSFVRGSQDKSAVFMNFNVNITPDARFQLIYNSQVGDMIRATGNGTLQVKIDPDFNIEMYGEYTVDRGDYLFTLKNVINKKFDIENGGKIRWNGSPYDATIDLNAVYKLKASLNDLLANSYQNIDVNQRIPVNCKISLKNQLSNPNIAFDIEFPTAEDQIREQVRQYMNTEEDMNKQMLSLLVMGKFYTPEYLRGTYEAQNPNLVGTTASELFSNQLSNWLSQISNDFDIGINYRPGNQITDDEIELALSTQIFNDRVTINGNISNNANQTGSTYNNSNSNIVGDFDVNVKLTNNGKLQLKAYNHSNNNIIYDTSPYKQGIGLSYRESYDTFEELWQKFLRLFGKKKAE
ncbi:translocation/assembly module TamB domain-containing protein [Mangrovibacterium diazotrophicum]|uniref:Uncharacterized protein DUF490 n=1 Tax=Mangrovibacterium diazotrophicum TaxID=1261403 RepID=A0A419W379_9BACT|nr:translocation/assembly module TamB domain-containing protein [Mangrovibacterium diazotrophicum]RKD89913.1 uncharacterized protein DUF490 [Mangrovibacterium diazotrophicum]